MGSELCKVRSDGQFGPFPGVTVISSWRADPAKARAVFDGLAAIRRVSDYYALLPYESYHMTVTNLYTKKEISEPRWGAFIDEERPRFRVMHHDLLEKKLIFKPTIEKVHIGSVISLLVTLTLDEERSAIGFASRYGVLNRLPPSFHLTLGYRYRIIEDMASYYTIRDESKRLVDTLFPEGASIELAPAALCYFDDMTHFEEWDASCNPFIPERSSSESMFTLFSSRYSAASCGRISVESEMTDGRGGSPVKLLSNCG